MEHIYFFILFYIRRAISTQTNPKQGLIEKKTHHIPYLILTPRFFLVTNIWPSFQTAPKNPAPTHIVLIFPASMNNRNRIIPHRPKELLRYVVLAHTILKRQKEHVLGRQNSPTLARASIAESRGTRPSGAAAKHIDPHTSLPQLLNEFQAIAIAVAHEGSRQLRRIYLCPTVFNS